MWVWTLIFSGVYVFLRLHMSLCKSVRIAIKNSVGDKKFQRERERERERERGVRRIVHPYGKE